LDFPARLWHSDCHQFLYRPGRLLGCAIFAWVLVMRNLLYIVLETLNRNCAQL
jgi:hypothetical protein